MTPVYALVCEEFADRAAACKEHLAERGVSAVFWRGIAGRSWGLETRHEYDPGKRLPPGHVGLNVGWWNLIQHIYLTPGKADDPVIILEDDVEVPELFNSRVVDLQIKLNYHFPDWDLVFLGLAECAPRVWHKVTERIGPPNSELCRMTDPFGTHAIMLRYRALPVILDNMAIAERNLDQQLWKRVLYKGLLKWCAVLPSMVTQRTFDYTDSGKPSWKPSTIHETDTVPLPPPPPPPASHYVETLPDASTPEVIERMEALVDPLPCVYRGESLEEDGVTPKGRVVPISQCALLRVPCHTRGTATGEIRTTDSDREVKDCEGCKRRQRLGTSDRPKLPLPEGHFNPSMLLHKGKLILATRDSWGHSKVGLWELTNERYDWTGAWSVTPISSLASKHPYAPRLEDPRLFEMPDENGKIRLCAAMNLPDGYPPKKVQVGYVQFAEDLQAIDKTVVYKSPQGNAYEKNWAPFWDRKADELMWAYSSKPLHIILTKGIERHRSDNDLPWTGGVIRGGAAPVFVPDYAPFVGNRDSNHLYGIQFPVVKGDCYYHFFHGCLKRYKGSVYSVGCLVFDAKPPYRVLRQTPVPLIWPDRPALGEDVVKREVVWPGGAVAHEGAWHLCLGIDDTNCRITRVAFEDVEKALSDVIETEEDRTTTVRNTEIALGVKAP